MTPHRSLYRIEGYADLWVDACLRNDEGELMFLSFYGRDASAMQFIAAAELGGQADAGISRFSLVGAGGQRQLVDLGSTDRLAKFSGRLPRQNLFGPLSHLWLYDKRLRALDKANRIGWVLATTGDIEARVWSLVKELAPIALLDAWQQPLLAWCQEKGAVHELGQGLYPCIGDLRALRVSITDHFIRHVSAGVRERQLVA
ncbi:hypothetical protein CHL79_25270 [Delftia acidovorans]|uniref:hypothetical protein n=1 Tax=Delftia acidovorans TaxID=80866 RepID=UPI000BC34A3C|nr:hypothetical protein [Delftia acidovorans]ATH15497.1 hypothetical protein CHL79_25270 [Delftia acidovorans]